jgi:hypothetical protein
MPYGSTRPATQGAKTGNDGAAGLMPDQRPQAGAASS